MASSLEPPCYLLYHAVVFFLCFGFMITPSVNTSASDYNLIYKRCTKQTFRSNANGSLSEFLVSSLFQELIPQSSESKFFGTSVGDEKTAIYGLFQCRDDLSNGDCYNCVSKLAKLSNSLCGETVPTRVQLSGCYIHYEADGSTEGTSGVELLHKSCSEEKAVYSREFQEARDGAFAEVEKGVITSSNGYVDMRYKSMHVTAQCEGNLEGCDCGECVSSAVLIAQDECWNSLSAQVYLHNCFFSYKYHENGAGSSGSGKLVAIVVGGLAVLGFGLLFFYFIKCCGKKHDDW